MFRTVLFVRRAVGAGQPPFARRCGHTPVRASCASDIEDLGGEPRSCFSAARCGHTCSRALSRQMVPGNIRCGVTPPPLLSTASSGADFGSSLTGLRGAFLSPAEKAKVELRKLYARMNVNGAFQLKLIPKGSIDLIGAPIRQLVADVLSSGGVALTPAYIEDCLQARVLELEAISTVSQVVLPGQEDAIHNANKFIVLLLREIEKLLPSAGA